jgi:two-component system, LuxR family, sensor kinase FixL
MAALLEEQYEGVSGLNEYFRSFIDSAPLLVCLLDAELKGAYFNQQWVTFTGRPQADLLGDQWISDIHPYDRARCRETWRKALDQAQKFEMEYRLRRFDGEFHYVLSTAVPQFSPERKLQCFINTVFDISARKAAEDALQHSEFRRRAVFNSSVGNVAVIDCAGRIIGVNDGWLRFARQQRGRLREVACGVNYLEVCQRAMEAGNPDASAVYHGLVRVLDGSLPEIVMEYRCPTPSEELWFEVVVHPLYRQEGGAIITHLNTTKRHRAELQAQTLLHELAHVSRVAVLGELTASVTHELSQPLMAIQTHAQAAKRVISDKKAVPMDLEEIVSDILADNSRAEKILQQLRAFLKKDRVRLVPLKLNNLIRDVSNLLRDEAARKKVKISLRLDSSQPRVRGERLQLQQVVLNLMLNAFEAMRRGRVSDRQLTIETSETNRAEVALLISDTGPGIPAERMEQIFEPFFTTKSDGLGMGLAICRSIIEVHGGAISVANNAEKGVSFRVVLPTLGKGNL